MRAWGLRMPLPEASLLLLLATLGHALATEPEAVTAAEPAVTAASDPFAVHARVVTLDNGLRVVVERIDRTDELALHLHVGVGSRDEEPGQYGLAHLFEHLMFEGSEHARGNAYDTLVTGAGGENNAFTTEDETAYHVVAPSGALERLLFLESDRLGFLSAGVTEEAVKNQIDVVIQEREQGYAAVHGKDYDVLQQMVYPQGHPYHRPVIGTVDDVEAFTVDKARAFHRRYYQPSNVVLGVVGNIDLDHAIERTAWWFSDVPDQGPVARIDPEDLPRHGTTQRGILADNVDDTTVYLSWDGAAINDPDEAALVVASFILSDGRGTRIDRHYYKKGWITDSDARSWSQELDGQFLVSLTSDKPKPKPLERILRKEVAKLASKPPSEAELDRARRKIRGLLLDSLERPADRVEVLVDCVRLDGDPDCTRTDWARIQAVTPADVSAAIARLGEPAAMLIVAPTSDAPALDEGMSYVEPM